MTVGKRDVTRGFNQQVQTIVFRDVVFDALDNAADFFREFGFLRPRLELIGIRVAQFVIRDTDYGDSRHE